VVKTGGSTAHPVYSKIFLAGSINKYSGANIKPWEIDELPVDWLDAIRILNRKLGDK